LVDYIYNKFLIGFECYDEDEFWERIDEDLLITIFERNKEEIDGFSNSLEMIPPFDGETMEDYVMGLAANTNDCVQDINPELPSLSIEDKNQFKQIKIGLEHGGFFGKEGSTISQEIEGQFLDYVMGFEKQFKDPKRIVVYEKVGKPTYSKFIDVSPEELEEKLKNLFKLLEQNNLHIEALYDYENETLPIYDFIAQDLFHEEIDDISISGMNTNFIYGNFHSHQTEELKRESVEFWESYFENDSEHFDKFTLGDLLNADEMIDFRFSFEAFSKIKISVLEVDFNLEKEKAKTKVRLAFGAPINK
jgi:hypothetical protein